MKEITIICNPAAGSGKAQKKWNNFQSELENSDVNYRVFFTAKPQHATKLTLSAIENGSKRIVSFGGDGTLNEIIQGILINKLYPSNEIELVVLGAGSSNDFEKIFPKKQWIEKINSLQTRFIDLIKLDYLDFNGANSSHYCINNSSIGIISDAGDRFNKLGGLFKLIKKVSVDAAALIAGIQTIASFKPITVNIKVEGSIKTMTSLSNITFYKNPYVAGGMYYNKSVKKDDGKFSVAIVESNSRLPLFRLIPSLYKGTALDKEGVSYMECESIELTTERSLIIETDGEIIGKPPVKYSIINKGIKVVV